jgi:serine/threonine protein kinase
MAPEVINGIDHGKPADVWALGCTIIEMLTARHPWAQFELPESAMYHVGSLKAMPPIPSHASPELQNFLQFCFASEPSERWTVSPLKSHLPTIFLEVVLFARHADLTHAPIRYLSFWGIPLLPL